MAEAARVFGFRTLRKLGLPIYLRMRFGYSGEVWSGEGLGRGPRCAGRSLSCRPSV